jgi:hypothetical protein
MACIGKLLSMAQSTRADGGEEGSPALTTIQCSTVSLLTADGIDANQGFDLAAIWQPRVRVTKILGLLM